MGKCAYVGHSLSALTDIRRPVAFHIQGVYEGLAHHFRSSNPSIVACTFNHRRPFETAVDFDSPEARLAFLGKYNNQEIRLQRVGANIRLSVVVYEGPTEPDWVLFYGRPADGAPLADTVVIRNLPAHWFGLTEDTERGEYFHPTSRLRTLFAQFGDIRDMDIQVRAHITQGPGGAQRVFGDSRCTSCTLRTPPPLSLTHTGVPGA